MQWQKSGEREAPGGMKKALEFLRFIMQINQPTDWTIVVSN